MIDFSNTEITVLVVIFWCVIASILLKKLIVQEKKIWNSLNKKEEN